ncbi:MAG: TetR/AcrR family transcriptional regulator [Actinobacteria bacterium]|nr:TetR/AcrR family transcriptional regulator [Actinomycetota bacterium]
MTAPFEPLTPERRRAITRQHLLDAAAMVFSRLGFHGASLDEVAKTAGFTKGAVYSNFKGKEDLFLALLEEHMARQFVVMTDALDTQSRTREEQLPRLAQAIRAEMWDDDFTLLWLEFVLYAARNPEAKSKLAAWSENQRNLIESLIQAEFAQQGPPPRYPTRFLAIVSTAIFNGLGLEHLFNPSVSGDDEMAMLLSFFYDAMGTEEPGSTDTAPR